MYQLPNGKVIHISIEEYLNLTHEDIQYLMAGDYGDHIVNPFKNSVINKSKPEKSYDFDDLDLDDDSAGLSGDLSLDDLS
tara:strand:+ start:220 stop:459 length:240 start_codon:yes stop_codon:yes gene_type:complete